MKKYFLLFGIVFFISELSLAQIQKLDEDFAYRFNAHTKLYLLNTNTDTFTYIDKDTTKKKHYYAENIMFHKTGSFYDDSLEGERIKYNKIRIVRYKYNILVEDSTLAPDKIGIGNPIDYKLYRIGNPKAKSDKRSDSIWIFKPNNKVGNGDSKNTYLIRATDFVEALGNGEIFKEYDIWKPSLGYGAQLSVPFKVRPKINDDNLRITPELQMGGYISMRYRFDKRRSRYIHLPFVTAGVSGLGINNDNKIDESTTTGEGLVMGTTFTIGSAIELGGFQLGVMMGWDKAGGEIGKDWIYNGRPWYSFGIGFTFLNTEKKEKQSEATDEN